LQATTLLFPGFLPLQEQYAAQWACSYLPVSLPVDEQLELLLKQQLYAVFAEVVGHVSQLHLPCQELVLVRTRSNFDALTSARHFVLSLEGQILVLGLHVRCQMVRYFVVDP
jgi:hypothetical protein